MPRGIIGTYNNWRSKRHEARAEAAKGDGSVPSAAAAE
jgi:hypothetical protein